MGMGGWFGTWLENSGLNLNSVNLACLFSDNMSIFRAISPDIDRIERDLTGISVRRDGVAGVSSGVLRLRFGASEMMKQMSAAKETSTSAGRFSPFMKE